MEIDTSKFKESFLSEFEDHLQMLDKNLLKLEKNPKDQKLLDELIRSAHTIKGSSATMGYTQTAFLTHVLEDVFDYARNGLLKISETIINQLFSAVDFLKSSKINIEKNDKEADLSEISAKIKKIAGVKTEGVGKSIRSEEGKPIVEKTKKLLKTNKSKSIKQNKTAPIVDSPADESATEQVTHIKVPVKRLDDLMDLMEELLIDKMKLQSLVNLNDDTTLSSISNHLSRIVSDIQYQVMQTRLVSLDEVFLRFPRMIRDLSQKYHKEIDLDILGGDLELDRTIIDQLNEPLVHLLRNAVDHGIDTRGTIKMQAIREREYALIKIEDDGEGINWIKVVEAAVKKNIIKASDKELYLNLVNDFQNKLSEICKDKPPGLIDQEEVILSPKVIDLLFEGRLSTNAQVTETSGRGVGLSIVKRFSQQMNGRLIIESPIFTKLINKQQIAQGTRFTLELPLSLAIIRTLLVEIKGEIFAIPFSSIDRSVFLDNDNLKTISDQQMAVVDDVSIPIAKLDKIFSIIEEKLPSKQVKEAEIVEIKRNAPQKTIVVLIKRGRDTIGIIVDNLIKEQEVIVKPMPKILRGITGFSGSTILGNGDTILILDATSLLEDTKKLLIK